MVKFREYYSDLNGDIKMCSEIVKISIAEGFNFDEVCITKVE